MIVMEQIHLAKMCADLSAIDAAEKKAALELLSANKASQSSTPSSTDSAQAKSGNTINPASSPTAIQLPTSTPKTTTPASPSHKWDSRDFLGFRPALSRSHSASNSVPGTPKNESTREDDIQRAKNLMALADLRAKIRDQDNTSLLRAREKMRALAAKQHPPAQQQHQSKPQNQRAQSASRFVFPRDDK